MNTGNPLSEGLGHLQIESPREKHDVVNFIGEKIERQDIPLSNLLHQSGTCTPTPSHLFRTLGLL